MTFNISKDKLKELCIEYDNDRDSYPESEFEGVSVYEYICDKLGCRHTCPKCGKDTYIEVKNIGGNRYGERKYIYIYKHYGLNGCEKDD